MGTYLMDSSAPLNVKRAEGSQEWLNREDITNSPVPTLRWTKLSDVEEVGRSPEEEEENDDDEEEEEGDDGDDDDATKSVMAIAFVRIRNRCRVRSRANFSSSKLTGFE